MIIRAAKVNSNNIVEDVIILNNIAEAPQDYVECNYWIGVGSNIDDPQPVYEQIDPVEKLKKFLDENQDVKTILNL
jgi:hypothetical protein